jgi:hypothetical protein
MRLGFAVVLLLVCLVTGHRAQAFGNCLDSGYLAYFREDLAPQPCDDDFYITIRAASGSALLRVIRLSAVPGSRPIASWRPQVEAAASGVGRAMDALGAGRLPTEITVLMTDQIETADGLDEVHADTTRIPGGECRVVFYKLEDGATPEEFTFSLAHEIFHCVQYESWRDAARVGEAGWWVEGSAEYFAHLAAPGSGDGQGFIDAFDRLSLTTSLTAMEYETVVFFAWLGHRGGPSAVGEFLGRMRPGDQISVLRDLVPEPDWISFVETWLDGGILLPGGQLIQPAPMASGERRFDSSGDLTLTAKPYSIDRWGARFVRDKRFDLTHDMGGGRLAMKILNASGPWEPPPETISTCDREQRHILYFTTTGSETQATLSVTTDPDTTGAACCLVGTWQPTDAALQGFADFGTGVGGGFMGAAGGDMTCGYGGGGWVLTFAADGTGLIDYDAYANHCTGSLRGGQIQVDQTRAGATRFRWRVTGSGAARLEFLEHSMTQAMSVKIGPMVQDMGGSYPGPATEATGMAFTCARDRLTVQGMFDLLHTQAEHTRVPAP